MTGSGRGGGGGREGGNPRYPVIGLAGPAGGAGGNLCITPVKVAVPDGGTCCRGGGGGGWYVAGCAAPRGGVEVATAAFCTGVEGLDAAGWTFGLASALPSSCGGPVVVVMGLGAGRTSALADRSDSCFLMTSLNSSI